MVWYGHVQQMTEERLPQQALTLTPQDRRKREKQKKMNELLKPDVTETYFGRSCRSYFCAYNINVKRLRDNGECLVTKESLNGGCKLVDSIKLVGELPWAY